MSISGLPNHSAESPIHAIDVIRKKRDRATLTEAEIRFIVMGASTETIPLEQLSAWLMACWLNGLVLEEIRTLTVAMRDSGVKFDSSGLGKTTVDKHSTGGVGDKTSFLVAPIAAACGLAVPMISGRALGHTGGTLDKLEAIPGYRTALTLDEFEAVIEKCGASIVSQTPALVPADRVLYALRDRTGTVESPGLICASILSKKLAAGLNALVLDVKTGSGAFLHKREDANYLAALMVATAEASGTRTVAVMTDMSQPLGHMAGNWIELMESVDLLSGKRPKDSEDLREVSLVLAGWMIYLGEKADSPEDGYGLAESTLKDGSALKHFYAMVGAQGGDLNAFNDPAAFHKPGATLVLKAKQTGYIAAMDTTALGWAVQRLGAGREKAGEPVDPHAGIDFHKRLGDFVEAGQPLATLYATNENMLAEPIELIEGALSFSQTAPQRVPWIGCIFTLEEAEHYLRNSNA